MPSRVLLVRGPLRTSSESVALDKAEAPDPAGLPAAGGRFGSALVVESQCDGVEEVVPVGFLPLAVEAPVDAKFGKARYHAAGDLCLSRPPVSEDALADGLGRVRRHLHTLTDGEPADPADEPVDHRVATH